MPEDNSNSQSYLQRGSEGAKKLHQNLGWGDDTIKRGHQRGKYTDCKKKSTREVECQNFTLLYRTVLYTSRKRKKLDMQMTKEIPQEQLQR